MSVSDVCVSSAPPRPKDSWTLDVVTRVGLGVSVVALGVAAATFLLCRALKGLRTTLHLHLSLSLLLAQGTFLLGIEHTQSPVSAGGGAGGGGGEVGGLGRVGEGLARNWRGAGGHKGHLCESVRGAQRAKWGKGLRRLVGGVARGWW